MRVADRPGSGAEFENMLREVFRKAGWRVRRPPSVPDSGADLVLDGKGKRYIVQLKTTSEGRRDRLIPLLSQAILEVRTSAQQLPDHPVPLAVVAAKRIPETLAVQLKQFVESHAPDVGLGVIDAEGFRSFAVPGLEGLDAKPARRADRPVVPQRLPDLFSDLNQWMLKILLGQRLPESLVSVPRKTIQNASQLAEAANVSTMSATRFVNQLANRGFLDEGEQELQVVRVEELLDLWISSSRDTAKEIPARWIIKSGPDQLRAALRQYTSPQMHNQPRCCLGLFAAADALGLGFVQGVPPHIYLERLTLDSLNRLGLVASRSDLPSDVNIRIPDNRESIFRSLVVQEGVPVSDVLQVWLDVSVHPTRGREQAREIKRRALKPFFGNRR